MFMKKLLISLVAVLGLGFGVNTLVSNIQEAHAEAKIVEQNGFKVLEGSTDEYSTIVCEALPNEHFGIRTEKGEIACQNVYDYADFLILTPEQAKGFEYGDVLLVTFKGDHVDNVQLNTLNVGDKVEGQKLVK